VLTQVKKSQLEREGKKFAEEDEQKMRSNIIDTYENESSCYYSTSRLWDDGVILPTDTRKVLGLSVMIASNTINDTKHGVFRM
jgi:3-methylcrotonyl-CoA carboxylase beta subunit